ncbi:MAG: hypothetical protein ACFE96_18465 [Candidatus Hermodarchaeota archaeon]
MSLDDNIILKFLNKLKSSIEDEKIPPRIEKAISMYKKEINLLYIDKTDDSFKAVVKSQSHPDQLEYAVKLSSKGRFFCGTQNLRPCGGLRGKICKHIILALIAVIKSNQGSVDEMINWVERTKLYRPFFNKDEATSIFLKYSNALEGVIEWRPVEVLPEDFFAF